MLLDARVWVTCHCMFSYCPIIAGSFQLWFGLRKKAGFYELRRTNHASNACVHPFLRMGYHNDRLISRVCLYALFIVEVDRGQGLPFPRLPVLRLPRSWWEVGTGVCVLLGEAMPRFGGWLGSRGRCCLTYNGTSEKPVQYGRISLSKGASPHNLRPLGPL